MSRPAMLEYLRQLKKLYWAAKKGKKTELLTQAVFITGKNRQTLSRYLSFSPGADQNRGSMNDFTHKRGRKPLYPSGLLLPHIKKLWVKMERLSAIRMHAALPIWLPHYVDPSCLPHIKALLLSMSRGTLERLLQQIRASEKGRGLSTTESAHVSIKSMVPINTFGATASKPGTMQADTVAHCGTSGAGPFVSSLTLTDLNTGWTENRALPNKTAFEVRRAFSSIRQTLPFELVTLNTDSGSEFINSSMIDYMNSLFNGRKINFTRSRPYRKNDNAFVEQKNYTHVRQLFGYDRLENPDLVQLMNEIYTDWWNPLHNFFLPSQKLVSKERVGSRIRKRHDPPQTPASRVMAHESTSEEQRQKLSTKERQMNPFDLAAGLELKLKAFYELYRETSRQQEAA